MCAYLEVAPPGLEPGTYRLVVGRSVQLSYGAKGRADPGRAGSSAPNHSPNRLRPS
jgi:hypothetical protein